MATPLESLQEILAGSYDVERELGHGGMATVYLARDRKHHRQVAIKVLDPELGTLLGADRFRHEIAFAARLQHPHILTLIDSGADEGMLYFVMPFVSGESLRSRLDRDRQLDVAEAVRLTEEVARALDYAHRQGVVHRDIKPENILLADGQPMVVDFGIAHVIHNAGGGRLTRSGIVLGTPPYMSPEQLAGSTELDGRSDVYALGCVLYEMLAGQPPFSGPIETLSHQHLNVAPRPVAALRPSVPPAVDAALQRALAKTPADRFPTAAAFADALAAAEPDSKTAAPARPAAAPQPGRVRRFPRAAVAAAGVLLVIAAGLAMWRAGLLGSRHAAGGPRPRQWVWLAAFEGPADDQALAGAAHDLVAAALDQSEIVATVPIEQVRVALKNAALPDTTRVNGVLARQLAYRSGIRVVVEGQLSRIGPGYSVLSSSGTAGDERALIPTLGRLARSLRRQLGERPAMLRASQPLTDVATPSFEAFKLNTRARRLVNANDPGAGVPLFRRALDLDSAFAAAWTGLGIAHQNMGYADSAEIDYRRALAHPDRLSEVGRLTTLAHLAGDARASIAAWEAVLNANPSPNEAAAALNNEANAYGDLGQYEKALAAYQASARLWPVGPTQVSYSNIHDMLLTLGRFQAAEAIAARMTGWSGTASRLQAALMHRQWSVAESLSAALESDPTAPPLGYWLGGDAHAATLAASGRVDAALDVLQRLLASPATPWAAFGWLDRASLATMIGASPPPIPEATSRTHYGPALAAVDAAYRGDAAGARRWMARQRWIAADGPDLPNEVSALVDGWAAFHEGRWPEAVGLVRATARGGVHTPKPAERLRIPARWLAAQAFERGGQPDSAVAYLELILSPPGLSPAVMLTEGLWEPFVRARLVADFARLGRVDEADRQWEALSAMCTHPDPPMVALLAEARATIQAAKGMQPRR
jgi:tetratricopeptide (TPR) repeat protein/tRNA A-37 threonylcarbamoyl transferase component Bud32